MSRRFSPIRAVRENPFVSALGGMAAMYVLLILAMVGADMLYALFRIGWQPTYEWFLDAERGQTVELIDPAKNEPLGSWIYGANDDFQDASELVELVRATLGDEHEVRVRGGTIVFDSDPGNLIFRVGDVEHKPEFTKSEMAQILGDEKLRFSIWLTILTCTISAALSVLFAVPTGYLLSRYNFPGKSLIDAILDIPIVLPPLVIGLSLLILFNQMPSEENSIEKGLNWMGIRVTFAVPAVIIAQFAVACAFSVRTMRTTFDQISPRTEQVAQTLGCSRGRAFFSIVIPESWRGISTSATLAWTRSMGEFGPILVFAGTMEGRVDVLSSRVYLEISHGNLEGAVIVSLLMVTIAMLVLIAVRFRDRNQKVLYHG